VERDGRISKLKVIRTEKKKRRPEKKRTVKRKNRSILRKKKRIKGRWLGIMTCICAEQESSSARRGRDEEGRKHWGKKGTPEKKKGVTGKLNVRSLRRRKSPSVSPNV